MLKLFGDLFSLTVSALQWLQTWWLFTIFNLIFYQLVTFPNTHYRGQVLIFYFEQLLIMDSDFAAGEDTAFVNDEISSIIKEAIGKGS